MVSLSVLLGVGTAAAGSWLATAQGDTAQLGAAALVLPNSSSSTGGDSRTTFAGGVAGGPVDTETPAAPTTSSAAPTTSSQAPAPTTSSVAPPPSTKAAPPPAAPKTNARSSIGGSLASQVVDLVNVERAKKPGCEPLAEESHLDRAAQDYSDDMSARNFFSHTNPEGVTFDQRIRNAGYSKPGGENIAKGQTSAAQVMESWMNSQGHKDNILNCGFTKIGVGVTTSGWYWVQDFGY